MKKLGIVEVTLFIYFFLVVQARADMGIGIKYFNNDISVAEGGSNCLKYLIYNPGTAEINGEVGLSGELGNLQVNITPNNVYLPSCEYCLSNEQKFNNSEFVDVCFSSGSIFRDVLFKITDNVNFTLPLPFYPKDYRGSVTATARGTVIAGGSSAGVVTAASLTVHIGNMKNFYNYVIYPAITIIVITFVIIFRNKIYRLFLIITKNTEKQKLVKAQRLREEIERLERKKKKLEEGKPDE